MKTKVHFFNLVLLIVLISISFISCETMKGATREGNLMLVDELIKKGEDVNKKDEYGWTPLLTAAYHNQILIAEHLLNNGAKVNHQSSEALNRIPKESTALHIAAFYNFTEVVKKLLNHGADINITDDRGRTALIIASYFGHLETVRVLMERGADPNIADKSKYTAKSYASKFNFLEIYILISGKDSFTDKKPGKENKK